MYTPLDINRENLTIMGIEFPDLKSLESAANAIGSNMFEGFEPTFKGIEIIRDYSIGKISLTELVAFAKENLLERAEFSNRQIKKGHVLTQKELELQSKNW
jgi:putative transcriptional regulator